MLEVAGGGEPATEPLLLPWFKGGGVLGNGEPEARVGHELEDWKRVGGGGREKGGE